MALNRGLESVHLAGSTRRVIPVARLALTSAGTLQSSRSAPCHRSSRCERPATPMLLPRREEGRGPIELLDGPAPKAGDPAREAARNAAPRRCRPRECGLRNEAEADRRSSGAGPPLAPRPSARSVARRARSRERGQGEACRRDRAGPGQDNGIDLVRPPELGDDVGVEQEHQPRSATICSTGLAGRQVPPRSQRSTRSRAWRLDPGRCGVPPTVRHETSDVLALV